MAMGVARGSMAEPAAPIQWHHPGRELTASFRFLWKLALTSPWPWHLVWEGGSCEHPGHLG